MSDDNKAIVQAAENGAATRYHDVDEKGKRPKCNNPIRVGEWVVVPIEEVPGELERCQKCAGGVKQCPDENESILYRARHGSPEDFGLEEIPEQRKRKWSKGDDT